MVLDPEQSDGQRIILLNGPRSKPDLTQAVHIGEGGVAADIGVVIPEERAANTWGIGQVGDDQKGDGEASIEALMLPHSQPPPAYQSPKVVPTARAARTPSPSGSTRRN